MAHVKKEGEDPKMKVTVLQESLAHGLSVVSRAVSPRSTLPVLSNVLVATDEGRLRLSATNLELGITCWIGAKIQEEGSITVPSRTFVDLVSTLPAEQVSLNLNTQTLSLNVRAGSSNTDIKCIDAQEFPPLPVPDMEGAVLLNVADFKEMINQVAFAASVDEARPVLMGVLVNVEHETITMAAADGFRLSVRKGTLSQPVPQPVNVIIPARALTELARVATDGNEVISMVMPKGRGQVIFRMKEVEVVSQLIDGTFPDFQQIIPRCLQEPHHSLHFGAAESLQTGRDLCPGRHECCPPGHQILRRPGTRLGGDLCPVRRDRFERDGGGSHDRRRGLADRFQCQIPARGAGSGQIAECGAGDQRSECAGAHPPGR